MGSLLLHVGVPLVPLLLLGHPGVLVLLGTVSLSSPCFGLFSLDHLLQGLVFPFLLCLLSHLHLPVALLPIRGPGPVLSSSCLGLGHGPDLGAELILHVGDLLDPDLDGVVLAGAGV